MPTNTAYSGNGTGTYRFGFNGQEKIDELHAATGIDYDFGARIYDARVGRFLSLDQFSKEYPMMSNYSYAANSPLVLVDKDGKFIGTIIGAIAGGVVAAVRGENIWKGAGAGALAGAAADLVIFTAGTGAIALVAAGAVAGGVGSVADQTIVQGKTLDQVDPGQVAIGTALGAGLSYAGSKVAPWLQRVLRGKTPSVQAGELSLTEFGGQMRVPQGLLPEQFTQASSMIRQATSQIGDDVVVQGSRATGTAAEGSDIDFAVKLGAKEFEAFVRSRFSSATTSEEATFMQNALEKGILHSGRAGLGKLERGLQKLLGMDVDVSVIRSGGSFDNGTQIPLSK